jgi:hypothetical protein
MTRDRLCRVTLAKPRPTPTTRLGAFVGELLPNGLEVTDLRVKFEVKRSTSSAPNTALITIYNLAPASRAQVIERPQVVMLEAGYRSTGLRRLFAGDVTYAHSRPAGADIETIIQAADGGRAFAHARVNRAFAGGVTALAALREVASAMGLSVPRSVELRPELGRQFVQGLSLFGSASDAMSRLLAPFGLGWSIQDGELRILDERGVGPGEALSIDQDAGMIGSPEVNPPSKPKGKPTVSVKCLLLPEAKPGGQVQLVSRTVTGLHKIKEAGHAGDTHGPEWTTSLEVTAL